MSIVGLEHEYVVRRGETVIDFRSLLPALDVPGRRLDPGDVHAYRLRSGAALTCDGAEAEIATPPVAVAPGFVSAIDAWARAGTRTLRDALGEEYLLEGVSTHVSVAVPDASTTTVAALFARHFAPAMMLLSDGVDSPGLLVRPRYERIELGTDYTSGAHRRAATALAVGGVLACLDATRGASARSTLPRHVRTDFAAARARWGWYIDRRAFGVDLYADGRSARLRRQASLVHDSGQVVLERSWRCARGALEALASSDDLRDADELVLASMPLPCERDRNRVPDDPTTLPRSSAHGDLVEGLVRAGVAVEAKLATWDYTVFALRGTNTRYVTVPRSELACFLAELRAGHLDAWIHQVLAAAATGRVLRTHAQALERAVFDEVEPSTALAAPERDHRGRLAVAAPGVAVARTTLGRAGKAPVYVAPQSFVPGDGRRKRWWWLLVALLAVLLVGGVAAGVAMGGGDDDAILATDTARAESTPTTIAVTTAPGATTATTAAVPLPSVVIRTTFVRPVTTYTVVISGTNAPEFTYAWRLIGNEPPECAARLIVDGPDDRSVTWDHPHPPCAIGSDHADTVLEVVGTGTTTRFTCRFTGAAESEQPCT